MHQKLRVATNRFPLLQEMLPTDFPSVNDVMSWHIAESLTRVLDKDRLTQLLATLPDALRAKTWYELTAYARLQGNAVDFYVLGFDAKSGLVGLPCSHATGRTGALLVLSSEEKLRQWFVEQEQIETWSSDQGPFDEWIADQPRHNSQLADCQNAFRVDSGFSPRPISECAQLSHS